MFNLGMFIYLVSQSHGHEENVFVISYIEKMKRFIVLYIVRNFLHLIDILKLWRSFERKINNIYMVRWFITYKAILGWVNCLNRALVQTVFLRAWAYCLGQIWTGGRVDGTIWPGQTSPMSLKFIQETNLGLKFGLPLFNSIIIIAVK